jgi:outer membrane autotransporter protein
LVVGVAAGYTNQRIDFDSALSVVGGGIRAHGFNVQAYALYDWDNGLYVSGSVGGQRLDFSTTRLITYPSFNIAVPSVNATASGSTDSNSLTSTFAVGWLLSSGGFGFEPYLNANYQHVRLAGYHESSVNNSGPDVGQPAGFDFDYAAQHFASLDTAFGSRFQYAFKPPFGVAVLYVKAEYHHLFDDSPTAVVSSYNAIAGGDAAFNIPGDKPDSSFFQFAAGTSFVFKHGIQAFLQYQSSAGIAYVSSHVISGGLRGEF